MKNNKKTQLTKEQQKALLEAFNQNPYMRIGYSKSEIKGYSDLDMFKKDKQIDIFKKEKKE